MAEGTEAASNEYEVESGGETYAVTADRFFIEEGILTFVAGTTLVAAFREWTTARS